MLEPDVTAFADEATGAVSYVVADPSGERCAVVDPVLDYDPVSGRTSTGSLDDLLGFVASGGLRVRWVLETDVHTDHLSAAALVRERTGARVGIGWRIGDVQRVFGEIFAEGSGFARDGSQFDHLFGDGERIPLGALEGRALHTPGQTPVGMSYVFGDAVFVGAALLLPDAGTARADLPGGDAATLFRSTRRLFALSPDTRVFPGHDDGGAGRGVSRRWATIGEERRANADVREGVDERTFVARREARDATLALPPLLLPALQVNLRAGALPPADGSGRRFLKIPLNAF